AEDGIRDKLVTGVQTCALPIWPGTFTPEDFRHYRQAWAQPDALTSMLNWYRALRLSAATPAPGRVRGPVRVIWGDKDAFLDRGQIGRASCRERVWLSGVARVVR